MGFNCYHCHKELDIMTIQMEEDLRFVFQALPSFGTRYSHLVMGYCQLFGVTPFTIKSKKLRLLIDEMKRLFESQKFSYQKKTYAISHAGIGEALDVMIKRHWNEPLDGHNYLKKVMITISEREEKDGSRKADADTRKREDRERSVAASQEKNCNCNYADAWRCAKDQNLPGKIACDCHCHKRRSSMPSISEGDGNEFTGSGITEEQRRHNLTRVGEIIKSIG